MDTLQLLLPKTKIYATVAIGFAILTSTSLFVYKKKKEKVNQSISRVFFFSDERTTCREHSFDPCQLSDCPIMKIKEIIAYLDSAKETLHVCLYFLTFYPFALKILELHKRNVEIKVITDYISFKNVASHVENLKNAGILVKPIDANTGMMHHKFVIIDKKLLISGSANWTAQAFFGNMENVLITNQPNILKHFNKQFESLWGK